MSSKLYLVRHGIAVNIGENGVENDADRMLSEEGRTRTRLAAQGLKSMGCQPDQLVSSPLVRAMQTAEIFAEALQHEGTIKESNLLEPGVPVDEVIDWLAGRKAKSLMLFGHMPDLADLAGILLDPTGHATLTFKKASACLISFGNRPAAGKGWLEWLMQPKALRKLAEEDQAQD